MPFPQFDRSRLRLLPIAQRVHDLDLSDMMSLEDASDYSHPTLAILAQRIREARSKGAAVLMMMGAHVIRAGAAPLLIRLMEEGWITHFAMNGAGGIHDFELALIGATTESVARYIREGQFGLWQEDGLYNEAVNRGAQEGLGFGESLGKYIWENNFPHRDISLLAAGYRLQIPVTIHVGIGCDIVHEQPNADGAAIGKATYQDFLIYCNTVDHLEGGVFLNFGSAVIGPEVYLKALSMCRNAAKQEGRAIRHFTTAVLDLLPLEGKDVHEEPAKSDPRYYFRPWKTIMARTVADGGESFYVEGRHRDTVGYLAKLLLRGEQA
ncbi:MAG: hypothetical protein GX418_04595 [Clostridiales bacterium]|nr:hypothetical protein [Clostridiales bacterium]